MVSILCFAPLWHQACIAGTSLTFEDLVCEWCGEVNMDETCVRCYETRDRGNVFNGEVVQRQAAKKIKLCMTLVAFVCDNNDVQAHLPQILVGNEHTFLQRDIKHIMNACRPNMAVVRRVTCFIACVCVACCWAKAAQWLDEREAVLLDRGAPWCRIARTRQ